MKKIVIIAIALISLHGIAQQENQQHTEPQKRALKHERIAKHERERFTPEEAASLQVKKMTLEYDLTPAQQEKMHTVLLKDANARKESMAALKANHENGSFKKPSKEERLKMANARLDNQIAQKAKMKEILNSKQFEKWEAKQNEKSHKFDKNQDQRQKKFKRNFPKALK